MPELGERLGLIVQAILYGAAYSSETKTRLSNALLIGEIIGQVVVGLICDYVGRKTAMVGTTLLIVIGGILSTAANAPTLEGMFWML